MTAPTRSPRRLFLRHGVQLAAAGALPVWATSAAATVTDTRSLSLVHTHTGEDIDIVFARGNAYVPDALQALNRFLRDHYSGDVGRIDPEVLALLHRLRETLGSRDPFEVISAYRCPTTNERLRQARGGGVATRSLHMDGRAIDVRLPGVPLAELRDAALALKAGGVGYYARSQFVHLDTGRVRRW